MPVFFFDKVYKTEWITVGYKARKAAINFMGGEQNDY